MAIDKDGKIETISIYTDGSEKEISEDLIFITDEDGKKTEKKIKIVKKGEPVVAYFKGEKDECEEVDVQVELLSDDIKELKDIVVVSDPKKNKLKWIDEDSVEDLIVDVDVALDGLDDLAFVTKPMRKSGAIQMENVGDGEYRITYQSEDHQPIKIEVVNGEGQRLFKQRVKNFFGTYKKDVRLDESEPRFYSVKVSQGDKEVIGEFQFR
jgi:outer membrane lipoprotein-sorting protein